MHDLDKTLTSNAYDDISDEWELEYEEDMADIEDDDEELAAELLAIDDDEEMEQFFGNLARKASSFFKNPTVKSALKSALIGAASGAGSDLFGSLIGAATGSKRAKKYAKHGAKAALSGWSAYNDFRKPANGRELEFEIAKKAVQATKAVPVLAVKAIEQGTPPKIAIKKAVKEVQQEFGNWPGQRRSAQSGRWYRRGNNIVLVGV